MKYMRKYSRMRLGRLQNKHRDSKRTKYNPSFGQNTGIEKKLVATYKQNAS